MCNHSTPDNTEKFQRRDCSDKLKSIRKKINCTVCGSGVVTLEEDHTGWLVYLQSILNNIKCDTDGFCLTKRRDIYMSG